MIKILIYSQEDLDLILELEKQENEELQQENKILKENAENNDKVVDKVNWENQLLKKENKQLKDNWNKLKEYMIDTEQIYKKSDDKYIKDMHEIGIRHAYQTILYKMYVLEQGSDSDE